MEFQLSRSKLITSLKVENQQNSLQFPPAILQIFACVYITMPYSHHHLFI